MSANEASMQAGFYPTWNVPGFAFQKSKGLKKEAEIQTYISSGCTESQSRAKDKAGEAGTGLLVESCVDRAKGKRRTMGLTEITRASLFDKGAQAVERPPADDPKRRPRR